jgi:hypothetical protein
MGRRLHNMHVDTGGPRLGAGTFGCVKRGVMTPADDEKEGTIVALKTFNAPFRNAW